MRTRGMYMRTVGAAECCICQLPIGSSEAWPVSLDIAKKRHLWSHFTCAVAAVGGDADGLVMPECKHWRFRGHCSFGNQCMFQHTPDSLAAFDLPAPGENCGVVGMTAKRKSRPEGKRNKTMNGSRCFVFRRFLHDTFGLEALRAGSGVVDVAGGKGELSFELHNLSAVPTTTIDPRVADNQKCFRKWERGLYSRNEFWLEYHPGYNKDKQPQHPSDVRIFFESPLVDFCAEASRGAVSAETRAAAASWLEEMRARAAHAKVQEEELTKRMQQLSAMRSGKEEKEDQPTSTESAPDTSSTAVPAQPEHTLEQLAALLLSCSCVVGMHPDQATEPIVDLCLALNKPFAVVPCCVFPDMFPDRRVALPGPDTEPLTRTAPVRTYEQFVEYLRAKDSRIRQAQLEFDGRNTVLWLAAHDCA